MRTISTERDDAMGMFRTRLNDGFGNIYCGEGLTKEDSEANAARAYKKYESCRNPIKVITLASDLREQEKVMAGLIEKAKRENLDHRLIAMANTDFERGFMALEKALNTNKG